MLRNILVKDFDHFVDRFHAIPTDAESFFGKNLMSLKGLQWHGVRTALSPAFTASKMKNMFVLMTEIADQLVEFLHHSCRNRKETIGGIFSLEMKDLWTKFAADVIGTTAYGVKINSLKDPNNEFLACGKAMTNITVLRAARFFGYACFPKLMKMLRISLLDAKAEKYFSSLIRETIKVREEHNIVRPDMIHLLMQAKKGNLKVDPHEEDQYHFQRKSAALDISDDLIIGQAVIFFFAGFDTISSVLSFVCYYLAMNVDVQKKLQEEIRSQIGEDAKKLTYEDIQKMKYLHMVISETLRSIGAPQMDRECVKDYIIPATDSSPEVHIKKGEGLWFSMYGLHHDPEYFPNPEKFDPERFNEENIHNIKPFTYMPFGMGPRNCIGMRFALMEAKIALIYLLANFDLCRVEKTPEKVVFDKSFNLAIEGGFWVGLTPRKTIEIEK
ncbi:hypothetical protein R5R35_014076 [Gryllus longicercus]